MASKKHRDAKRRRDAAKEVREEKVRAMKAIPNKGSQEWRDARDDVIRASSDVRKEGNIMRAETGREMGEGTSYTGALQP